MKYILSFALLAIALAVVRGAPDPSDLPEFPYNTYIEAYARCLSNESSACPAGYGNSSLLSKLWYEFDTTSGLLQFVREDDLVIGPYGPPSAGFVYDQSYLTVSADNSSQFELQYWYLLAGESNTNCFNEFEDYFPLTTDYLKDGDYEGIEEVSGVSVYVYRNEWQISGYTVSLLTYVNVETSEFTGFYVEDQSIEFYFTYFAALDEISKDIKLMPFTTDCQSSEVASHGPRAIPRAW